LVSLKVDVLHLIQKTLSAGLLLSAFGSFLCLFLQQQWRVFLFPYRFIYSRTWFSIQQIVANPLAIKMGSPILAHHLTLAGINSFGTTIGAILLGIALFGMGQKNRLSLEDINYLL
jgi:FHS family L-fucose permease-like MFS transporter